MSISGSEYKDEKHKSTVHTVYTVDADDFVFDGKYKCVSGR
uniref:Uncharacterized protein n=1 Tax=Anguilla anguilla TaxID=7936 RepID=A0A0E9SC53_ANGAN